ncbi:MAG TPA: IclR family transcriptional regulator [Solirubrobacteraceae bacterium]|nr:IclR family transcriptional regulator [Solirubrobacteraceae bacterium]
MPAGALERAVDLLGRLGETGLELTVAELAAEAGMPTSTAYRLLAELEQYGLVQRSSERTVALGTRLVALGRTAEAALHERLVTPAEPVMARLAEQAGETVLLTAPCANEGIVLHAVEGRRHSVRLTYTRLARAPMHRGASGKVLAAYLDDGERARLLEVIGDPGLERELRRIRADGFVVTHDELDDGAGAVAVPILDRRERLLAGLSLAGPQERIAAALPELVDDVREAAAEVRRAYLTAAG